MTKEPPVQDGGYLPRPRLESRLDEVMTRRLAVVVAGAGYGKSTLVGAWAADRPTAWCALDEGAASLRAIAGRTIRAFRALLPDLPTELEMAVRWSSPDAADSSDDEVRAQAQAALLCEALDARSTDHIVLVIDDLHEVPEGSASLRFIEALVRGAPSTLHIVATSRQPIPFAIQRLRGQGQIVEIGADRLRFDEDEVAALLARLDPPMPEAAPDVLRVTQGWPALVRLVIESFRDEPPDDRIRALDRLVEPGGRLFAYLAEEVLDREPAATLEVLRIATRFDQVDAGLLTALGVSDTEAVLTALTGRALFIESRRDAPRRTYSLHHLLGETVEDRWPLPAEEVERLRSTAADWLEANDRPAEALAQRIAIPDPAAAAVLLETHGARWLQEGSFATIVDGMAAIPPEARTPALDLLLGDACLRRGDWDVALEALGRAAGDRATLPPGIAWRIGLIQHERGEAVEALATFERADLGAGDPEDLALVAAWRATTYWQRSDPVGCRPWAEFAMEAARRSGSDRALAAAMAAAGAVASMNDEPGRTEDVFRQAVALAERAGDVLIGARYRADLGYVLILEGRYADALVELDAAVQVAGALGHSTFRALAHADRGYAHLGLGHLEEAGADFDTARALYERVGSRWVAYAIMRQGNLFRIRGDLPAARRSYEEALPLAEALGPAWFLAEVLIGLAYTIVDDEPDRAMALAERAVAFSFGGEPGPPAALGAARVALLAGDRSAAARHAERAFALADGRHDRPSAAGALEVLAALADDPARARALLDQAGALWAETGSPLGTARHLVTRAEILGDRDGLADARTAAATYLRLGASRSAERAETIAERLAAQVPPAIEIQVLGGFRVLRDGVPVGLAEWQSRKARDLLKILVVRRGRPITREQACELLWPDEDPGPLLNRLSVALATIRNVLDPDRRSPSDHYIRADKVAISLDLANAQVDVERFLAAADAAMRSAAGDPDAAGRALDAAEAAYGGEVLAEDPYADWAEDLREEARAAYLGVARQLAERAASEGDADRSIRLYLRILGPDPFDEEAHLGLVRALAGAGRHGEARRRYGVYTARMAELDVEAAPYPVTSRSVAAGMPAFSPP